MDVTGLNNLATNMLNKFGQTCDVIEVENGSFNGKTYDETEIIHEGLFAFLDSTTSKYNTTFQIDIDEKLAILKTDFNIDSNTQFIMNGVRYALSLKNDLIFKDAIIVYKIILREVK